jgi:predicted RNA-binding Zn ribbon-like protein
MTSNQFDLDAGALCLDFANTAEWHASDQPQERLNDYFDLLNWGQSAGILSPGQAEGLGRMARNQPEKAAAAYGEAIRLREAIYRIFAGYSEGGSVGEADLAILNGALGEALAHQQITTTLRGFAWDWAENQDNLAQIMWPVSRSAGELLTSGRLDRVRQCADDRGCGYLFIDTSRNRSRRWCSMDSCGNRAKARRYQKRHKVGQ